MGRPKGSKNRRSFAADLLDEVTQQDEEFVRKDNAKVLGVANGESTDEDEDDESKDEWLPSLAPSSTKLISSSQPMSEEAKAPKSAKSNLVNFVEPRVAKPRMSSQAATTTKALRK
jgi:hypothetical protein